MNLRTKSAPRPSTLMALVVVLAIVPTVTVAQDRLKTMPGYERYKKYNSEIPGSVRPGVLSVTWTDDGAAFEYRKAGKNYRYDIAKRTASELAKAPAAPSPSGRR